MTYLLFRIGRWLVLVLPLRVSYAGASLCGLIGWFALREQRANAVENMTHVVGQSRPRRARALARRSFQNYACYVVDFIRLPGLPSHELLAKFDFDDWARFDAALARGRGCILVVMHFGNWDMGGPVLALRGYPFNAIAETQAHGRLNDDLIAARTARGVKLIPMERAATGIVRAMRRNETLAILIDRPLDDGGIPVQFFDAPVRVPAGPARIALRTGAKLIAVSQVRRNPREDGVRVIADFGIEPPQTGNLEQDVRELTQRVMAAHERVIRRYPDQWYMFRRMWRTDDAAPARSALLTEA